MSVRAIDLDADERAYLLGVLRAAVLGDPAPAPPTGLRWERLHRVLVVDRLVPIFHHYAANSGAPPAYVDYWQRYSLAMLRKNRVDTKAAVKLFDLLDAEGIPSVGMRGLGLARRVYADPMLRPMSDVDLLVPKNSSDALIALFEKRGEPYTTSHNQLVCDVDGCKVEIHWHMIKRLFAFSLDFGDWTRSRQELATDCGRVYVLPPEDELIGVICHGFIHHDMDTLLKVLDVAMLCERCDLDWKAIAAWVQETHLETVFGFTLALVDHLLGTSYREQLPRARAPEPGSAAFDPYVSRMFGIDTRRNWIARFGRGAALADTPADSLRMVMRYLRLKDAKRLVQRPFDTRDANVKMIASPPP